MDKIISLSLEELVLEFQAIWDCINKDAPALSNENILKLKKIVFEIEGRLIFGKINDQQRKEFEGLIPIIHGQYETFYKAAFYGYSWSSVEAFKEDFLKSNVYT